MCPPTFPIGTRSIVSGSGADRGRASRSAISRAAGAALIIGVIALGAGRAAAVSAVPPRVGALPLQVDGVACGWLCVPDQRTTCGDGQPHIDGCPVLQHFFEATPGGLAAAIGWKDPDRGLASQPPERWVH